MQMHFVFFPFLATSILLRNKCINHEKELLKFFTV